MTIRSSVRSLLATGAWRPASARLLLRDRRTSRPPIGTDQAHLAGAAAWLARAQDARSDGGISGRYFLSTGWSASYPETTGYIIPTFLALADELDDSAWRTRAERALRFLLALQLPDGAFPGGEIDENTTAPSVFNTGQILNGLVSWHEATGDPEVATAARRAGEWLCSVQEADGSFRRHTYLDVAATYHAHATCWLADASIALDDEPMRRAVRRHVAWCLEQYDPAARWLDRSGFTAADQAARRSVTHTFAYALFGILHASQQLGITEGVAMVTDVAGRAAELTVERGTLPGHVDAEWAATDRYTCLTGSVQMALVWQRLAELQPSDTLRRATDIAIDEVKASQPMRSADPGLRGGVPGSRPIWGPYIPLALPNWAAKFLIDALVVRQGGRQPGRMG